ncbi:SPOSA6832_04487 [Sporobolomyces salmonicolor]|uniref:SPOSA6832_04487-mRNA-1:cds n=1 Tax=Sporidiobolus salmonicolor TaxID=5005 RepID=A0A0D6ESA0_SPOSA|nr:SPOSA6832_04487 [Sporobolomyces salmonicolor]
MDLSVPEPHLDLPEIEVGDASSSSSTGTSSDSGGSTPEKRHERSVDKGYDGDTVRKRLSEIAMDLKGRAGGPRDYLAGPTDELVIPLPRPSPLSATPSALPSPAISTTSTSSVQAEPILEYGSDELDYEAASPSLAAAIDVAQRVPLIDDDSTPSRPRPRAFTLSHSAFGSFGTFPSTARSGPLAAPTLESRFKLFFLQLFANAASAAFLLLILVWALASQGLHSLVRWMKRISPDRARREWDTDEMRAKYENERVVKDIRYYARSCGFDVIEQTVETKDGYLLKMFKVVCLKKRMKIHTDGRGGFPVLIQHGLFQSCGSFITSEERSLAFWLAEHGLVSSSFSPSLDTNVDLNHDPSEYQVYLGNNRGVFDMGHSWLKRSDPRFWGAFHALLFRLSEQSANRNHQTSTDYNIKELALYDLPAMVDHVRRDTGYDKVGHCLHRPLARQRDHVLLPRLFIALAPAVYAGPLTSGFPFTYLKSMKWKTWRKWFGVLDFIPLMRISYDWTPSKPFGLLGYQMFAFLFNWTDANWLLRRKPKKFRFTPSPVSSASIFWWTGYNGFSTRGCVLDPAASKWFDKRFPPLSIHHGGKDYLVLTEPLLERLKTHETDVDVIRVQKMDDGEHCDFFWSVLVFTPFPLGGKLMTDVRFVRCRHIDAVELCFHSFIEDIEKTRPRYPEERASHSHGHRSHHHHQQPSHHRHAPVSPGQRPTTVSTSSGESDAPLRDGEAQTRQEGETKRVEVINSGEGY